VSGDLSSWCDECLVEMTWLNNFDSLWHIMSFIVWKPMYSSIRSYCPLGGFQLLKQPLLVIQGHGTVHLCLLLDKHNVATVSCAWWAVCLVETPKWIHHFTGSICCFSSTLWELCRAAVNFDPWLDKKNSSVQPSFDAATDTISDCQSLTGKSMILT